MKREALPVIFRRDRNDGEVTAVFPTLPTNARYFTTYAHIGQHGSGGYDWFYKNTEPAKPEEYAALLAELRAIYETGQDAVKLKICTRVSGAMRDAFNTELMRWYGAKAAAK